MEVLLLIVLGTLAVFCVIFWLASILVGLIVAVPAIVVALGLQYIGVPTWLSIVIGIGVALYAIGEIDERRQAKRKKEEHR